MRGHLRAVLAASPAAPPDRRALLIGLLGMAVPVAIGLVATLVAGAIVVALNLAVAWALRLDPPDAAAAPSGSDGGIVIGWTHYLAFDLFVGCWIAEKADARGVRRVAQAPVLLATFMAGPAGLLLWFIIQRRRRA